MEAQREALRLAREDKVTLSNYVAYLGHIVVVADGHFLGRRIKAEMEWQAGKVLKGLFFPLLPVVLLFNLYCYCVSAEVLLEVSGVKMLAVSFSF